jgi:acyl carrier protein
MEGGVVSVAVEVEKFILQEIALGRDVDSLDHDLDLADGVIDSLGIVELIVFLEDKYAIKVDDDDLTPENFKSVNTIVTFVESKRA